MAPGAAAQRSELMAFTEDRIRARGIDEVVVAYVCNPEVGWSAVVGYRCNGVDDLPVGDSMVTVPTAYFAHFTNDADDGDPVEDVWDQVELAEKEGRIERAYGGEVATIRSDGETDLFIRLV
ncbi:hypothetical protein ACWDUD_02870 [Rhodococcus sp. NPDC003382]|uniref:hypothetical protein n=1 Tax=unclassified Rhodococcus (in: high G+C Gram-positive bacteria) TaxID=192944 RepID=UPI001E33ADFD|nr:MULTISPECIES: hypothetical protein [unclassified Rhodococcus (in: high G+C Gram-positive bacteria)]MCK8674995.1 hypothetical protein [Rhodococcus sp. HM1]